MISSEINGFNGFIEVLFHIDKPRETYMKFDEYDVRDMGRVRINGYYTNPESFI